MNAADQGAHAEGVGIAYHPFLHDVILQHAGLFDFVEMPTDLYADPARSALLDPDDARLREIAAACRCVWRGTALSLGSAAAGPQPAFPPGLVRRIRHLLAATGSAPYTEAIGFRRVGGCDLGQSQQMPGAEAAARWIATCQLAAREALEVPVVLRPVSAAVPAPPAELDEAGFLHRIAALSDCCFAVDATDLARIAAASGTPLQTVATRLPAGRIVTVSLVGQAEEDWALLSLLVRPATVQSIVLQRDLALFPAGTLVCDARRAAAVLAQTPHRAMVPPCTPGARAEADPGGLAALHASQTEFIAYVLGPEAGPVPPALAHTTDEARRALVSGVQSLRNRRGQVDNVRKTQQFAAFLRRGPGPQAARGA